MCFGDEVFYVMVSMGVSVIVLFMCSIEEVFVVIWLGLYCSKGSGKNRISGCLLWDSESELGLVDL